MAIIRGIDDPDPARGEAPATHAYEEIRPATRAGHLATGTLACGRCDAPVALAGAVSVTAELSCPFCAHTGPVRDFLSLGEPTRPMRVSVRILPL